jgi:hypothetical protein
MREEVQTPGSAGAEGSPPQDIPAPPNPSTPAIGQASADAIAQLGVDLVRLVEVVDSGFERIEAVGAKQVVDLRSEVAQMLSQVASQLELGDQPAAHTEVEAAALPQQTAASEDSDHPPLEAVVGTGADISQTPAVDDPDADLFDAPPDLATATSHESYGAPVSTAAGDRHPAATADEAAALKSADAERSALSAATFGHLSSADDTSASDHEAHGDAGAADQPLKPLPAASSARFSWLHLREGLFRRRA